MLTKVQKEHLRRVSMRYQDAVNSFPQHVVDRTEREFFAYVESLLAAERERNADICKRLAEHMEGGAGEGEPGGRLRQAERMIRDEPDAIRAGSERQG